LHATSRDRDTSDALRQIVTIASDTRVADHGP